MAGLYLSSISDMDLIASDKIKAEGFTYPTQWLYSSSRLWRVDWLASDINGGSGSNPR